MTRTPIRIAVIGLDHWYAAIPFAQRVAARAETNLALVADVEAAHAKEIAVATGASRWTTDLISAATDPDVDAIACFTSVDRSAEISIAAAQSGKHIVSVKPLAMTIAEADTIVDAVAEAGVVFVPSEARRSSPLALKLDKLVHGGQLGELISGTFAMNSGLPESWPGGERGGWWVDPSRVPGGGWIDHAIYHLDRMAWLFDSEVRQVSGVTGRLAHSEISVEDYGHAIYQLESGAIVTIEDTWIAVPGASTSSGLIIGTQGSVMWDSKTDVIGISRAGEDWAYERMPADTFDTLDVLIHAVHDGIASTAGASTARRNLKSALGFYSVAGAL